MNTFDAAAPRPNPRAATERRRRPPLKRPVRLHELMALDPDLATEVKSLVHEALQEKAELDRITGYEEHLKSIDRRLEESNNYKREILGPVADLAQNVERVEREVTAGHEKTHKELERVVGQVVAVERTVDSALQGDHNAMRAAVHLGILTGLSDEELRVERKRIKDARDGAAVMAWFGKRRVQVGAVFMAAAAAYSFLFGNERAPGLLALKALHWIH